MLLVSGKLLADLINEHPNPWAKMYDPFRHTLKSLPRFLKHNLRVQVCSLSSFSMRIHR